MTTDQSYPVGQQGALATVDYVVAEILNDIGNYSTTEKQRITGLCISAIREIRLFHQALIQVEYPKINEAGIIPFPPDMVDYIAIGIPTPDGRIDDLWEDPKMLINRSTECGTDSRTMEPILSEGPQVQFLAPTWGAINKFVPTWYGSRILKTAYYKVDKTMRQIQFNGYVPNGDIVLVYKSTGISANTLLPIETIDPIKRIVMYEKNLHNLGVPDNYKERLKREKDESINKLRAFTQKFTMAQYKQVLYQSKRQTNKP